MKDLRQSIRSGERGVLESILDAIPGYGGYRDKQLRRDADRLLREHIAEELGQQLRRLSELQRRLVETQQLQLTDDLERVARRLQTVRDQVRTAPSGYAGFFDVVKIREAELDRLYEYDRALLDEMSRLHEGVTALGTTIESRTGVEEAIRHLGEDVDHLADYWRRREDVVLQA